MMSQFFKIRAIGQWQRTQGRRVISGTYTSEGTKAGGVSEMANGLGKGWQRRYVVQTSGLMKTALESLIFGKETKVPLKLKRRDQDSSSSRT